MKKFSKSSSTSWESSYFGGVNKVLYDHPDIYVSKNVGWDYSGVDFSPLSWYTKVKLIKLFLLMCNQFGLNPTLLKDGKVVKASGFMGIGKETRYVFNSKSVAECLNIIFHLKPELVSLFITFETPLIETKFYYVIDSPDNQDASTPDVMMKEIQQELDKSKIRRYSYESYGAGGKGFEDRFKDLKDEVRFVNMKKTPTPVVYTSQQTLEAAHLVKLLDISFDPKPDVIPDLRAGKLTPSKIGEIPAGNFHVYHRVEENQSTRPFSVCILADESGSMRGMYDHYQNHLLKVLYKAFSEILPAEKIHVYGHSGDSTPVIRIYNNRYNLDFEKTIENQLGNRFEENYDGPVIEAVYEKVREQTDDNILFISISDGVPGGVDYGGQSAIKDLKRVIEKCKRDRFVTVGIGLDLNMIAEIYNYHTVVTDTSKMVQNVTTLINRVVKTEFQD